MLVLLTLLVCSIGWSNVYGAPAADCHAVINTDCNSVANHDIPVCGDDGHSYNNECFLKKTACLRHTTINKAYDGRCGQPITGTPKPNPTTNAATTKPATVAVTTQKPTPKPTTPKPTTTTMATVPTTTVDSEMIALDIFCLDISYVKCGTNGPTVCSSTGKLYDNLCEFDKARCTHRDMHANGTMC